MNGRGTKELEQLKSLNLKMQKAKSKSFAIFGKKESDLLDKSYISTKVINPRNLP